MKLKTFAIEVSIEAKIQMLVSFKFPISINIQATKYIARNSFFFLLVTRLPFCWIASHIYSSWNVLDSEIVNREDWKSADKVHPLNSTNKLYID
jgi:hypothetical protein